MNDVARKRLESVQEAQQQEKEDFVTVRLPGRLRPQLDRFRGVKPSSRNGGSVRESDSDVVAGLLDIAVAHLDELKGGKEAPSPAK